MVRLKKDNRTLDEVVQLATSQAQNVPGDTVRVTVVIPSQQEGGSPARYQVDFVRQSETLVFEAITIVQ
jgi:hypothetical protein